MSSRQMAVQASPARISAAPAIPIRAPFPGAYAVAIAVILAVAAGLRLVRLDLVEFTTDDGTVLRLAEDWVRLGRMPLVGMPASLGVPLPPWFIYILAPFVAITRDPRFATGVVGVLNVVGVAGVVYLGWRFFRPWPGWWLG